MTLESVVGNSDIIAVVDLQFGDTGKGKFVEANVVMISTGADQRDVVYRNL